ncbi:MAG: CDP-6-deoxy-delta-3,4-glucoseen reductase [Burkholderiaceae bacterium]
MSFRVKVLPSGREFDAQGDESILDAALREAVVMPYGCKDGVCGTCKARVLEGEVEQGPHAPAALDADERAAGFALVCCASARSPLVVEARLVAGVGDIPLRKLPCRINAIERVAPDVAILRLQLPAGQSLRYLAGQYIELILRDGTRRSYSMASPPEQDDTLELHVRHLPGGRFTDALFGVSSPPVAVRDILRFEGPMGTFFLREDDDAPIVLLASGTGFAPIKAIVERVLAADRPRPMMLYWGGRRPHDLYMDELAQSWRTTIPGFRYVPVVSDPQPVDGWQGRTGFVHRAVMADLPDLSGHRVYACGAPVMVDAARADFVEHCGLPVDAFFADAFVTAADAARVA